MKKAFKVIVCNLILFCLAILISDLIIYKTYANNYYKTHPSIYKVNKFGYHTKLPYYVTNLSSFFNGMYDLDSGRLPNGIEYNSEPILLFGCSYAYGRHLKANQTFSAKLSKILKRPVYNRAISGGGFQHMYMQSISDSFYKDIPQTNTVIYVMINDHYRRTLIRYFDILDTHILPHFSIHRNKLHQYNYKNIFLNFIYSLYTVKYISLQYTENYINNEKTSEKLTDMAVLYFTETRNELQKHWNKKINFSIILYEDWDIKHKEKLKQKLKQEGFTVISTKDLTNEDLKTEKWQMQDNHHPTEEAWNMLTPKIIERLNLD